jgi:flavodoxin
MNAIVIYSTHRGNTEKVAQEIAAQASCKAVRITENFDASTLPIEGYDLIFLGTGIRGGEPYAELIDYLKAVDLKESRKRFVIFMTWAGGGASNRLTYERLKQMLEARGQHLGEDFFICLGQTFGFSRRGRPNAGDLAEAKKWATKQLESMKNLPSR